MIVNEEIMPIEVKDKSEIKKEDLKNLMSFMRTFNVKKGYVIYLGKEEKIGLKSGEIEPIPPSANCCLTFLSEKNKNKFL